MGELLVGTTLLVSFLGGVVALLAPCCVSVMLPAYLATGFRHRGGVLPATLVFGVGIATVILPIGLGAAALSRLFVNQHLVIYLIGGVLMGVGGVAVLGGRAPTAHARRPGRGWWWLMMRGQRRRPDDASAEQQLAALRAEIDILKADRAGQSTSGHS
ncbi:hypothetical protein GCM10010464_31080 [Pseudonocardia yunnanensis]|uniref:Cytochrome c biogenesis protein CcdA n=1 Tax=Pseudonocardia yunnanensis TaxID=58107 RepID=A0ABW4ENY5_9PSEU